VLRAHHACDDWRIVRAFVLLSLVVATTAWGQPQPDAAQLFDQGDELEAAGKYAEACPLFERSYAIDHATGAELRLADCYEHVGRLVQAWQLFDAAELEWARATDARAAFARQRSDALSARVALVELALPSPLPTGIAVEIASHPVQVTAARVRTAVDPGPLAIIVSAPGHASFSQTVTATVGEQLTVAVPALEPGASTATAHVSPPPAKVTATAIPSVHAATAPAPRSRTRFYAEVTIAGLSLVSFTLAGGAALAAYDTYHSALKSPNCIATSPPQCNPAGLRSLSEANDQAGAANLFDLIGAAGAVAVGVLYFTRPRDKVSVTPTVSASGVGVTMSGGF
jgi:tetratricopeptide (TPR) repeat protein